MCESRRISIDTDTSSAYWRITTLLEPSLEEVEARRKFGITSGRR